MTAVDPLLAARNAAIELCDHLPDAYRAPVTRAAAIVAVCLDVDGLECVELLTDLLDEITDALGVQARLGAGG